PGRDLRGRGAPAVRAVGALHLHRQLLPGRREQLGPRGRLRGRLSRRARLRPPPPAPPAVARPAPRARGGGPHRALVRPRDLERLPALTARLRGGDPPPRGTPRP